MTYHLEPWIEKIVSPVVLTFPDGKKQEYLNGKTIANTSFCQKYNLRLVRAVDNKMEIELLPHEQSDSEESFF